MNLEQKINRLGAAEMGQSHLRQSCRKKYDSRFALGSAMIGMSAPLFPLSEWEIKFINELCFRYTKYGSDIRVSEKQMAIIDRILTEKCGIVLHPPDATGTEGEADRTG